MARKQAEEDKGPDMGWLMTYGDLMTLLVTFFVLLLTFSSIQEDDFKKAMGSLQGAFGVFAVNKADRMSFRQLVAKAQPLSEIEDELAEFIEENESGINFDFEMTSNQGIRIVLENEILFDPGSNILKTAAYPILNKIGEIAKKDDNVKLLIEGHTDNIPIRTIKFESNWELSSSRAISVVKYFTRNMKIEPPVFTAVGHGEYKPLVPNTSPKNRAKNRRVEVFINYREQFEF